MIVMAVFGGTGKLFGPLIGAFSIEIISETLSNYFLVAHTLFFGTVVILAIVFTPKGLIDLITKAQIRHLVLSGKYPSKPNIGRREAMIILEGKNITKRFAGLLAVSQVDFSLKQGEILGLIGPNGAGKTTLVNVIAGVYTPSDGETFFKGKRISGKKPYQIGRMGVSRTFQVVKPFPGMTVKENAAVGAMYGAGGKNKSVKQSLQKAEEILEFVGLANQMNKSADQLGVASRKRLEMAKASGHGA